MKTGNRPLSPHLWVYLFNGPFLSMTISVSHRFSGMIFGVGTLFLAYWLTSAAYGPEAFARAQAFMGSWFGLLLMFCFSMALFYHMCTGIRHLIWDTGYRLDKEAVLPSCYMVLAGTVILTGGTWIVALVAGGG